MNSLRRRRRPASMRRPRSRHACRRRHRARPATVYWPSSTAATSDGRSRGRRASSATAAAARSGTRTGAATVCGRTPRMRSTRTFRRCKTLEVRQTGRTDLFKCRRCHRCGRGIETIASLLICKSHDSDSTFLYYTYLEHTQQHAPSLYIETHVQQPPTPINIYILRKSRQQPATAERSIRSGRN